jgi:signal transduction histidine kinase
MRPTLNTGSDILLTAGITPPGDQPGSPPVPERARAEANEAEVFAQLRLLNRIAQVTAGTLDLGRILEKTLYELNRYLPLHVCLVWLRDTPADPLPRRDAREPGEVRADASEEERAFSLRGSRHSPITPRSSGRPAAGTGAVAPSPPEPEAVKLVAVSSAPRERAEKLGLVEGLRLKLDQTPFAPCLDKGQAQHSDLAKPDGTASPFLGGLAAGGAVSSFAVPLRGVEQTVGVLQAICTRADGFTHQQVQLLYLVADLLGPALSNCLLFSRLRQAYEQLRYTQNQLIQAEKMRALGELAGGMAHDFNNSLCGVLGFLELALASGELPAALRGYLESARTCSLDAAQTVRRVQNFARWQRNELSIQLLDLNELVQQTVELTRPRWENLAQARGIAIQVEVLTEAKSSVPGSAAELREVLTNLVFNAVDAMPQGGQLTLRTWSSSTDVFLSVQDSGTGMSDSVRKRIFEPFFSTKGERGNGLGLSVTFGIIQRYGGEIAVQTAPGQGSTFTVRLPLRPETNGLAGPDPARQTKRDGSDQKASPSKRASQATTPARPPAGPARSLRILVVEDEASIRGFLDNGLKHLGHRPRLTADAAEAIAALAEEPFDLVLTDLGLPGGSGEDVARAVVRQSPRTPVILLTGWSSQLQNDEQQVEGVAQILGKPVTLKALADALNTLCPPG